MLVEVLVEDVAVRVDEDVVVTEGTSASGGLIEMGEGLCEE